MSYGVGLLRGLGLTLKHFVDTYAADIQWLGRRYTTPVFKERQGVDAHGIFTVEYPDEKLAQPENFRFVPFLVVNNYDDPYAPGDDWCTSCGICAKVCPPQCIWIVRGSDPVTGRPVPQPEAFYIDIDICMNCGYCAEYCPFDAIKMDHDYELASFDRTTAHVYDKKRLSKEFRYWQTIAPTRQFDEAQLRGHWEHKDVEKIAKKAGVTLPPPTDENMWRATTVLPTEQALQPAAGVAAPAGTPQVAAGAAAAVTGDPMVIMADERLPLAVRAKAALAVKNDKDRKLTSADRKVISAVQKLAKDQGTTIEALSEQAPDLSTVQASAAPAAAAPAAPRPAAPVAQQAAPPMPRTNADQLLIENPLAALMDEAQPLNVRSAAALRVKTDKGIKLSGENRKAIAAVQKLAKDQGTTIEALAETVVPQDAIDYPESTSPPMGEPAREEATNIPVAVEAAAPAAPPATGAASGVEAEVAAARELERKGKAKEIKLTGEDRKRIAAAKALAQENNIEW